MKHSIRYHLLAVILSVAAGVTLFSQVADDRQPHARAGRVADAGARLMDAAGRIVGEARLEESPHGILLRLDLTRSTPGVHALHIHERGVCQPPTFESAGGHLAAADSTHGFLMPGPLHAGDLPNLHVPTSLELSVEQFVTGLRLRGTPTSLLDGDGTAIVMHAGSDDYRTEPAGAAGERLACGVIVATK
jgi:Cu-Zn family superoxide dismutase